MSDDIRENQFLADIRSAAQGQPTYYDLDPVINKEKYYADIITALKNGGGGGGFTPTTEQLAAMNSGIDSAKVNQIETNKESIDDQQNTTALGGNGYAIINGIRLYVASSAPTGNIPDGSVGVGW